MRLLLVAATIALAVTPSATPASGAPAPAAAKPAVGKDTGLKIDWAWIHFLPTVQSDHLTAYDTDHLSTVCYAWGDGNEYWDVVYDRTGLRTGYTPESYLTDNSFQPCSTVGQTAHVFQPVAWMHLHTDPTWEYQIVNPGDTIGVICSVYDNNLRWDLVVNHSQQQMVGFVDSSAVAANIPADC
ncbi:hypothetical protein CF165_46640 [Amycolatopsis vastitatis]|uniref:SH3 domain-containing protein n=1 Tax=Amycolatopsis vastitatis TaxID=1905142 RepID=A0A229SL40_9PSEU|nr:hypothetical protein CF165_46640 [Amycolatopsis vastitatis]